MKITLVVPVYNELDNIGVLVERVRLSVPLKYECEFLFVDDGSTDDTLVKLKQLNARDTAIRFVSFSRNFGHQAAIKAGLDHAEGQLVLMMDADLQHPPELIPRMLEFVEKGYDIVTTERKDVRSVPFFKRLTSVIFYRLIGMLSDIQIKEGSADFRIITATVRDILVDFGELDLFWRGIIPWVGFKQISIPYEVGARHSGVSKYSFVKMISLALRGITSFSLKPLFLSVYIGLGISALAFGYGFYAMLMYFFSGVTVSGWTSILVSVLFIGGINLIMIGVLGTYLGKVFLQTKNRPIYIIKEKK